MTDKHGFLSRPCHRHPFLQEQNRWQSPEKDHSEAERDQPNDPEWARSIVPCFPREDGSNDQENRDVKNIIDSLGKMGVRIFSVNGIVPIQSSTGTETTQKFVRVDVGKLDEKRTRVGQRL
jgi:hypothetical protein